MALPPYASGLKSLIVDAVTAETEGALTDLVTDATTQADRASLQAFLGNQPFADETELEAYTNALLEVGDSTITRDGGVYVLTVADPPTWVRDADSDGKKAGDAADRAASLFLTATTGRPAITTTDSNASAAGVFIFGNPETKPRNITKMRVRRSVGTSIDIEVGVYALSGGQFTLVRGPVTVTVPGAATSLLDVAPIKANLAEHLGYSIPGSGAVGIVFLAAPGDSGGYYYHNVPGAVGPFTPSGGLTTSVQLQIGFDGDYAEVYDDLTEELQPQIDANVAAIAANAVAISENATAINDISQEQAYVALSQVRISGTYTAFPTGGPSSKAWSVGFLGTALSANTSISALITTLHRGTGIENFEAMLYSRPIATTSAPSGSDTALWGSWVSVSAASVASGAFGDVAFTSPVTIPSDPTLAYLLVVRAKNSGGTIVDMGFGRAFDADTGLTQVQRGFYRNPEDTGWIGLGVTAPLNIRVTSTRRVIRPRKKRAAMMIWGRTQLVFNNSTPKTYRRTFTVPVNATRVVSVIFAHGGTSAITIAGAAVAPIASAANYAASGVNWTPLRFSGSASGAIQAAAGSLRLGMRASDEFSVPLLDRTDVLGAGKIIMVSAYCSTAGNLTLLGSAADNDDYRTNWQSRSDFPSIIRRNDGDCVTTPASFASTTNEKSGTMIAGIVVECDNGELLSVGAVGDSITNGAGIQVPGDNTYGLGWVEKTAYSMNTAHRGVMPVMLGWSGLTMPQIADVAGDFYNFVAASGIPAPHIMFAPNASPNSMTPPLTAAQMNVQLPLADGIALRALGAGSIPIAWTVIPVNPSVKDFNATDSFRRDYNAVWRGRGNAQSGYIVADFDASMAGVTDPDGQVSITVGLTSDGIHPNAAGYDARFPVAVRATRQALPALGYAVGGLVT